MKHYRLIPTIPLLALTLLSGCASNQQFTDKASTWVGADIAAMVTALGPPLELVDENTVVWQLTYANQAAATVEPTPNESRCNDAKGGLTSRINCNPPQQSDHLTQAGDNFTQPLPVTKATCTITATLNKQTRVVESVQTATQGDCGRIDVPVNQ